MRAPILSAMTLAAALCGFSPAAAQSLRRIHQIEGRIHARAGEVRGLRVRLLRLPAREPVGETFSRPEGRFEFKPLTQGEYAVETFETENFEATLTTVEIAPLHPDYPLSVTAFIELPLRPPPKNAAPGVVKADVDVDVPSAAAKHYRNGMKALGDGDSARAVSELQKAVEIYPNYYAARLGLGRELRQKKRFREAEETLGPLVRLAPGRAEPHVEYGIVLLELKRRDEALGELRKALQLNEPNWAAHLYAGWALLEAEDEAAARHFRRALELDERRAARAHLALARLAHARGEHRVAVGHLEAYLALAPDAHDAEAARRLAEQLRSPD